MPHQPTDPHASGGEPADYRAGLLVDVWRKSRLWFRALSRSEERRVGKEC